MDEIRYSRFHTPPSVFFQKVPALQLPWLRMFDVYNEITAGRTCLSVIDFTECGEAVNGNYNQNNLREIFFFLRCLRAGERRVLSRNTIPKLLERYEYTELDVDPSSIDVVLGPWLLCSCWSEEDVRRVLKNMARVLKPGGSFLTVVSNPHLFFEQPTSVQDFKYGVIEKDLDPLLNGVGYAMTLTIRRSSAVDETTHFEDWPVYKLYQWVLDKQAGLNNMDISYYYPTSTQVSAAMEMGFAGLQGEEPRWWTELINQPANVIVVMKKREDSFGLSAQDMDTFGTHITPNYFP